MSARRLRREWGVVIRCNADGCDARYHAGLIRVTPVRRAAAKDGWIRGLARGKKRLDFCPAHHEEAAAPLQKAEP